jgi:hypothetical protein
MAMLEGVAQVASSLLTHVGKIKVSGPNEMRDVKGLLALDQQYFT